VFCAASLQYRLAQYARIGNASEAVQITTPPLHFIQPFTHSYTITCTSSSIPDPHKKTTSSIPPPVAVHSQSSLRPPLPNPHNHQQYATLPIRYQHPRAYPHTTYQPRDLESNPPTTTHNEHITAMRPANPCLNTQHNPACLPHSATWTDARGHARPRRTPAWDPKTVVLNRERKPSTAPTTCIFIDRKRAGVPFSTVTTPT
jgi:hypothetical protein